MSENKFRAYVREVLSSGQDTMFWFRKHPSNASAKLVNDFALANNPKLRAMFKARPDVVLDVIREFSHSLRELGWTNNDPNNFFPSLKRKEEVKTSNMVIPENKTGTVFEW